MLKFYAFCRFIAYFDVDIENNLHISIPQENKVVYKLCFLVWN